MGVGTVSRVASAAVVDERARRAPTSGAANRRGRREGTGSATARALVDAAAELMRERDTLDISFVDIGARAGQPPGLIGYYFGNKEGLLHAVLERDALAAVAQLEALTSSDLSPTEKMRLHLRGVVNAFWRTPYFNRLLQAMTRDAAPGRVERIAEAMIRPMTEAQGRIIDEGVAAGAFRPVDKLLFYFAVVGAADALHSSRFILSTAFGVDGVDAQLHRAHAAQVADTFLRTLLIAPDDPAPDARGG